MSGRLEWLLMYVYLLIRLSSGTYCTQLWLSLLMAAWQRNGIPPWFFVRSWNERIQAKDQALSSPSSSLTKWFQINSMPGNPWNPATGIRSRHTSGSVEHLHEDGPAVGDGRLLVLFLVKGSTYYSHSRAFCWLEISTFETHGHARFDVKVS